MTKLLLIHLYLVKICFVGGPLELQEKEMFDYSILWWNTNLLIESAQISLMNMALKILSLQLLSTGRYSTDVNY